VLRFSLFFQTKKPHEDIVLGLHVFSTTALTSNLTIIVLDDLVSTITTLALSGVVGQVF